MRNALIADDHEVTRRGLRELLQDAFEGVDIVEASDGQAVLQSLALRSFDLLLLDVMMPGPGILELLHRIRRIDTSVPILTLTAAVETEIVIQIMKAGANGLIHKHRDADDILEAIRTVGDRGSYLHHESALEIAAALREERSGLPHEKLSRREFEIFRLIALGRAIKEIGADLALSDRTVATYLGRIRDKTGLMSHVDIARYALQKGLVD